MGFNNNADLVTALRVPEAGAFDCEVRLSSEILKSIQTTEMH